MVNRYISLLLVSFSVTCTFCSDNDEFDEMYKQAENEENGINNEPGAFLKENNGHVGINNLDDDNEGANAGFFANKDNNHEEANAFNNGNGLDLGDGAIIDEAKKDEDIKGCLVVPTSEEEEKKPDKPSDDEQCCS